MRTGVLRWSFHTIPHPGEPGYETWPADAWKTAGAANNWAGMALDTVHGIVYAPTGSAVMDFYGADRIGDDLYANTILALDAATGKLLWHFQGVHHDIWDRDLPSPPVLVTPEYAAYVPQRPASRFFPFTSILTRPAPFPAKWPHQLSLRPIFPSLLPASGSLRTC